VLLGVATATAVLAGALVVGDSVRGSLRDLALQRLGRADIAVSTAGFFREGVADDLRGGVPGATSAPLIIATGAVTHEQSRRRAAGVLVYGVDARFWSFHGVPEADGVYLSPALASELGLPASEIALTGEALDLGGELRRRDVDGGGALLRARGWSIHVSCVPRNQL